MAESVMGCIHTQRALSDYRGDRGLHTGRFFFEFVVGRILEGHIYLRCPLSGKKSILYSGSTPVHLKSTKHGHLSFDGYQDNLHILDFTLKSLKGHHRIDAVRQPTEYVATYFLRSVR